MSNVWLDLFFFFLACPPLFPAIFFLWDIPRNVSKYVPKSIIHATLKTEERHYLLRLQVVVVDRLYVQTEVTVICHCDLREGHQCSFFSRAERWVSSYGGKDTYTWCGNRDEIWMWILTGHHSLNSSTTEQILGEKKNNMYLKRKNSKIFFKTNL